MNMDVCKTDIALAARLLREAAGIISKTALTPREADKARQMKRLSNKLQKRLEQ